MYTAPPAVVASGGVIAAATDNTFRTNILELQDRWPENSTPLFQGATSPSQSINNNTNTVIPLDLEELDPFGWHSTVTNTDRCTPTIAGQYRVTINFSWQSDTDYTRRLVEVWKNGTSYASVTRHDNGSTNIATGILSGTIATALIR